MDVLGIIGVAAGGVAIPLASASTATSVVGISQSANGQQQQASGGGGGGQAAPDPAADPRLAKFNIVVFCDTESSKRDEVNRKTVVLRKNKVRSSSFPSILHCSFSGSSGSMLGIPKSVNSQTDTSFPGFTLTTQPVQNLKASSVPYLVILRS